MCDFLNVKMTATYGISPIPSSDWQKGRKLSLVGNPQDVYDKLLTKRIAQLGHLIFDKPFRGEHPV